MNFINLDSQYKHLKRKIDKRIHDVLKHGQYIMGPEVKELELKLAEYVGVKHAITCANGTDALSLAMMALKVKKGDAVFCPTFTFFATGEVIAYEGATPVFVDSDEDTFNICPMDLEEKIKKVIEKGDLKPKAIISVDLFGLPANYKEIDKVAKKYNLKIIEDAAQGFGGRIGNKRAGSFGDIGTTSFFPAKPLGCYGDGGAIFTDNDDDANLIKSLRVHGMGKEKYDNVNIGMNSRLDTMQAAILLEKLDEFPYELDNRCKAAKMYGNLLDEKIKKPTIPKGFYSSWAQYTVRTKDRKLFVENCKKNNIPTNIYYPKCLHEQEAFNYLNYNSGDFPIAERLCKEVISLPMDGYIRFDEDLIKAIKKL